MIKLIAIVVTLLIVTGILLFTLLMNWVNSMSDGYTLINKDLNDSYYHKDGQVYYVLGGNFFSVGEQLMENADLESFEVLDSLYARDKHHAYINEKPIPEADAVSFQLISGLHTRDARTVFYMDRPVLDADPDTFVLLWNSYAQDKNYLYNDWEKLTNRKPDTIPQKVPGDSNGRFLLYGEALYSGDVHLTRISQPTAFHLLNEYYASDNKNVYYELQKLPHADYLSFRILDSSFAKDKHHIYLNGRIIIDADPESFETGKYQDDKIFNFYHIGDHYVQYIAPENLRTIDSRYLYKTDGEFIYTFNARIEDADIASFEIIDEQYSRDQQRVFFSSTPLLNADPQSFRLLKHGFSRDNHHLYWNERKVEGIDPEQFTYEDGMWAKETEPGKGILIRSES